MPTCTVPSLMRVPPLCELLTSKINLPVPDLLKVPPAVIPKPPVTR